MSHSWRVSCLQIVLALCGVSVVVAAGDASRAAEPASTFEPDMPRNTWVLTTPTYLPLPGDGQHRPQTWNKLVYDSVGRRAIFIDRLSTKEHSHSIYANAVFVFDVATDQVECLGVSNWTRQERPSGGYQTVALPANIDYPTPCDRHPYGNVAFVPERNAVYLSAGANQTAMTADAKRSDNTKDTWRFDLAEHRWHLVKSEIDPPGGFEQVMCYDPSNQVIVRLTSDGAATWLLDTKTEQWRNANAENNPRCGKAAAMCYDSKRERIILFGARGRTKDVEWNAPGVQTWEYRVKENVWKALPDAPIPGRAAGMDYDPVNDCVMLHFRLEKGKPGRTLFYLCDKNEWRTLPAEVDARGPNAPWHGLAYDAAHEMFIRTDTEGSKPRWWLFRPDISKTIPATAPTQAPAGQ